jgi:hypothetical protein
MLPIGSVARERPNELIRYETASLSGLRIFWEKELMETGRVTDTSYSVAGQFAQGLHQDDGLTSA